MVRTADRAPIPGSSSATATASPIESLLFRCEPRVRELLAQYEIAPEDTEELLHQALIVLVYRWEDLADPEAWLFATLRAHCHRHRQGRGDPAVPDPAP